MTDYNAYNVLASHPVAGSQWDWSTEPRKVEVKFEDGYPDRTGFVCKADNLGMSGIIDCQDEQRAIKLWLTQHGMQVTAFV